MENTLKFRTLLWEVFVPLVLYYVVNTFVLFLTFTFIQRTTKTYLIGQIIAAAVTIPFIYFASYKPTQANFVSLPKPSKRLVLNIISIIVIIALISFGLNNIITMSPLMKISKSYSEASDNLYGATIFLQIIGTGVLGPILEELVFRGIVFANLRKIVSVPAAILLSSFLFGVIHFNIVQFAYAFFIGIVLAIFMYKSEHMYAAMIGHITANLFAIVRTNMQITVIETDGSVFAWCSALVILFVGVALLVGYLRRR